jgi:hypothetical protein
MLFLWRLKFLVCNVPASDKDFAEIKELMGDWRVHAVIEKCRAWDAAERAKQFEPVVSVVEGA